MNREFAYCYLSLFPLKNNNDKKAYFGAKQEEKTFDIKENRNELR